MPTHSTLARLQQALALGTLATALAWLLWQWPRSPVVAVTGAALLTLGFSLVLAVEFVLLAHVRRTDPVPAASFGEMAKAWLRETLMALRVFGWRQPFRWRSAPDRLTGEALRGRTGVVLVHGFVCNRGFWTPWLRQLEAGNRAYVAVNLEPVFGAIDAYTARVQEAVERVRAATGCPPVLVCHSMGGLVARAWWQAHAGERDDLVARVVTIGSPHAGTWLARFSHLPNGRQMRIGNPWLSELARAWTPVQARRFTCWYSNCDNIVMPPSTAMLPGADNRLVRGAAHVDLAFRAEVMAHTWALLEACDAPGRGGLQP